MITEKLLIDHCSLTLSSLKTASLFTVKFININSLNNSIKFWNDSFFEKGLQLKLLKAHNNFALIYLYREDMLKRDLNNFLCKNVLLQYGYCDLSVENAIKTLSSRLYLCEEFPHEIGLFLGYPPKDVEGFICNEGKNCTLCKYWKVYKDKDKALKIFLRYDKCQAVYKKLWQNGRDILQLTVKRQVAA